VLATCQRLVAFNWDLFICSPNLVQQEVPRGMTAESSATRGSPSDKMVSAFHVRLMLSFCLQKYSLSTWSVFISYFGTLLLRHSVMSFINETILIFHTYIMLCIMSVDLPKYVLHYISYNLFQAELIVPAFLLRRFSSLRTLCC
jgi:hypothetical protein